MITLPPDIINRHEDIEQWCSRGIVMARVNGEDWAPFWYRGYDARNGRYNVSLEAFDGHGYMVPYTEVAVHWPQCGSVNLPTYRCAVHVQRLTQKQYCRTYTPRGVQVIVPRAWEAGRMHGLRNALKPPNETVAMAVFNPQRVTYEEAEDRIRHHGWLSCAITNRLIVAGDKSGKRMFYYNGELVATGSDGVLHPQRNMDVALGRVMKLLDGRYHAIANQ